MKTIYSEGGISSLYKGYCPGMLGSSNEINVLRVQETVTIIPNLLIMMKLDIYFQDYYASVQTLIDVPVENLKVRFNK